MIRFDQLKQYLCTIDKKVVVLLAIVLWLHGVTVGIVFEGQKGLLNRFLWTIVIAFMPMWMVIKSSTWRRTATVWLYFELATFIMCCSNSIAWYRNPKNLKPLPDMGHDILPIWKDIHVPNSNGTWRFDAEMVPDMVMGILMSSTLVFSMLHPRGRTIFHRFFIVYGTLCIMRSVCVISTSLPDSAEKCRMITPTGNLLSGAHPWSDITIREVLIRSLKLLIPVGEVTCGDMVFSGHTMLMVLCAMTWHTYYKWVPGSVNHVKVTIWVITIFGLVSIVWVRMHYSLDVVLALYFAVTVWASYHRIANDIIIGHRFSAVWVIDALLFYPAIEWIETSPEAAHLEDEVTTQLKVPTVDDIYPQLSENVCTSPLRERRRKEKQHAVSQPEFNTPRCYATRSQSRRAAN